MNLCARAFTSRNYNGNCFGPSISKVKAIPVAIYAARCCCRFDCNLRAGRGAAPRRQQKAIQVVRNWRSSAQIGARVNLSRMWHQQPQHTCRGAKAPAAGLVCWLRAARSRRGEGHCVWSTGMQECGSIGFVGMDGRGRTAETNGRMPSCGWNNV